MARIRSIKPGYFVSVDLAEASAVSRLLGIALLTMADRSGRLKDSPKAIKHAALPWDAVDVDELLDELQAANFILRYEVDGARFIQVLNFSLHQVPHIKEATSTIPAPCENGASIIPAPQEGKGREGKGTNTPLTPQGDEGEIPFTELPPGNPDDDEVVDRVLEEKGEATVAKQTRRGGPDLTRPVTAAPKPGQRSLKEVVATDERFAAFRAAWPNSQRRNDRTADLIRYWRDFKVGESPRFEQMMTALTAKKRSADWTRTDKDVIPAPAAWINSQPWMAAELGDVTSVAAVANPYDHKPWGPIWLRNGKPQSAGAWMNLLAHNVKDVNPHEIGMIFETQGLEAAGDWFWQKLQAAA